DGIVANARRRPWLALPMLVSMVLTLRRAARGADLVHAHWLLGGAVARLAGRPFVVTLHGSPSAGRFEDLRLAARFPRLVGWIVRRARAVLCVSTALADAMRACGARDVRVIPNAIEFPPEVEPEDEPPFVLFVGRLAPEKGIADLVAATEGMRLRVAGD